MLEKLSRKRSVPFNSGQINSWAAGIIYAIGQVNFLFDKLDRSHGESQTICNFFQVSSNTASSKAKLLRIILKIKVFDPEFSRQLIKQHDPFARILSQNARGIKPHKTALYKEYEIARECNSYLIDQITQEFVDANRAQPIAELLGYIIENNRIQFSTEKNKSFFYDLVLHEVAIEQHSVFEIIFSENPILEGIDKEILEGHLHSIISLFEVISVDNVSMTIKDLLNSSLLRIRSFLFL